MTDFESMLPADVQAQIAAREFVECSNCHSPTRADELADGLCFDCQAPVPPVQPDLFDGAEPA